MSENIDYDAIDIYAPAPTTEPERQYYFIAKCRNIVQKKIIETGTPMKMAIQTFGCQMNAHDSEKIEGMLTGMGYTISPDHDEKSADIIVYNTCCVRENAENKVYGNLGFLKHFKQEKPDMKVILCGCMMQQDIVLSKIRKAYRHVDIVFGTFNLYKLPELLYTNFESNSRIYDIWEEQKEIVEDLPSVRQYPFKASVNIMFGCNNFCSYCIVPYVRGRERSRTPSDIIEEVKSVVATGALEVTLLGQNVNSYGNDLDESITFAKLLRMINEVEGLERIRFMTSHPKDLSMDLIEAMRDCDKVCNHLHLPFQSGSTDILTKMNRKYSKEKYLELIQNIQKEIPNIHITTDIIVGFPSETEEDFEDTLDVVKAVRFSGAFSFLYSKRTGTPAAVMEEQIPPEVTKDRFGRLMQTLNPILYDLHHAHIGHTYTVLAESFNEKDHMLTGRLTDNSIVHFVGDECCIGTIMNVNIIDCKTFYLTGEIV